MADAAPGQAPDDELMRRLAGGDVAALGPLYLRHGGAVRSFLLRLLDRCQEAEDLCQEVFLTLQQTAARYEARGNLRAWVFGIAARKARAQRRKRWIRQALFARAAHEEQPAAPGTEARLAAAEGISSSAPAATGSRSRGRAFSCCCSGPTCSR